MEEELVDGFQKMSAELERYGVVFLSNDDLAKQFAEYNGEGPPSCDFMNQQGGMRTLFMYDMEAQPDGCMRFDGMCWRFDHPTEPSIYAIGISKQAIERGRQRTVEVFIHEAAHVLHGIDHPAHDDRFRDLLKMLFDIFNKANGTGYNCI